MGSGRATSSSVFKCALHVDAAMASRLSQSGRVPTTSSLDQHARNHARMDGNSKRDHHRGKKQSPSADQKVTALRGVIHTSRSVFLITKNIRIKTFTYNKL